MFIVFFIFLQILIVFKHAEVGSSPKEPDFDIFPARREEGG